MAQLAIVLGQHTLLDEKSDDQPEEGQRRESAFEEIAHFVDGQRGEADPAQIGRDVQNAENQPDDTQHDAEKNALVPVTDIDRRLVLVFFHGLSPPFANVG